MTKISGDTVLTSHQIALMLQVSRRSINNWIEQGRIPAFRTPGRHRRVRARDLVSFLRSSDMPVPEDLAGAGKRKVMIVDDEPLQLRALGRVLSDYRDQADVILVERGIDALVLIGKSKPDVVVLDIFMPHLDGLEVCRRLKANPDTEDIDVLVCSARLTPELEKAALAAGAFSALPKPLERAQLLAALGLQETDEHVGDMRRGA